MTDSSSAAPPQRHPRPLPLQWPKLGLGCASLGNPPPGLADADAEAVMVRAIERGIRFFDVAPLYGGGLAEARLGRALKASGLRRDDYVLCTKTGVTRPFGQGPIPPGGTRRREADVWDYSERATRASVAKSLERLGVDRLDVVHLHDAENHLDVCLEAWNTLDALRDDGVVCGIGIGSNLPQPVATLLARAQFDAFLLAGRYTLLDQSGANLFARAAALGVRVVAGGVFNSGVLAAWPPPSPTSPTFDYVTADAQVVERTGRIAAICAKHGVPLGAAALQFVLRHPAVTTVLIGPRSVAELDQNLAAAEHRIPDVLWVELRAAGLLPESEGRAQHAGVSEVVTGDTDAH
jgi:D-threo-aldose 1-dehydrogenase